MIYTGDVVRLNSGSPKLTVVEVLGNKLIVCWHDGRQYRKAELSHKCVRRSMIICLDEERGGVGCHCPV